MPPIKPGQSRTEWVRQQIDTHLNLFVGSGKQFAVEEGVRLGKLVNVVLAHSLHESKCTSQTVLNRPVINSPPRSMMQSQKISLYQHTVQNSQKERP